MTQTCVNNAFTGGVMTVLRSTAGSTTTASVTHSDNTNASSKAIVKIETGGASGGDPFISFSNSVANFTLGIDNSSDDDFVLSENAALGTSNSACCDDGIWTYENNSCFSVNLNGTAASNVTGNDTIYTPHFSNARYNIGSDYNTGTYIYTVPVTGVYFFAASYVTSGDVSTDYSVLHFEKNGSRIVENLVCHWTSSIGNTLNASVVYSLTAGDTIEMSLRSSGSFSDVTDLAGETHYTYFMGALVA